ncbi:MAG TPA: UvrD-helicase domain-containing protein [Burkholderiales bacterium]|nr:UvrD-helicase domain-containing protein [Burkholderiales bacterium]
MTPALADQADRDQIATALDDTLIVEAAAGTGKTTELVRRIVRVIETGRAEVTGIVAVTFTEKAAGELKLRLREALEEARRVSASTSTERARLDRALGRLEEAQVGTIHGFCADLLRERPVEARIDPLFKVLTETQAERVYDEAFHRWLESQLADPPQGVKRSLRRPTFGGFGAQGDGGDNGPVDRLRRAGWELIQWRDFYGDWQRPFFDRTARVDELVQLLSSFSDLLEPPGASNDTLYMDSWAARKLADEIRRIESVATRDYDRLEAGLIELGRNRSFKEARKGSGRNYRTGVVRDAVWRAYEKLLETLRGFEADANADLAAALRQELRGCIVSYEAAKAKSGALDFLDLLLKARDLIRDNPEVRASFQQRFKRIFVDEFQDTDPLQAEILLLLAAGDPAATNWRKARPVAGKLFLVGDPKQSIYRFRRADVGIYRGVYEMLQAAGAKRVTLRTSFRARPNIQRAINAAFEPVMTGDDNSLQAAYVPLEPFRSDAEEQPSVIALPVPEPYGYRRLSNVAIEKSLPDAVGAFIDWLINHSGWRVAERPSANSPGSGKEVPVDPKIPLDPPLRQGSGQAFSKGGVRTNFPENASLAPTAARGFLPGEAEHLLPVQARHICLLFRRFISFQEDMTRPYVEALEARGIAHLLVGGRSFHNRAEIETLRAALSAIEWPEDELSVFAALRGSLFAISDEDLLEYRHKIGRFHPFRIPSDLPPNLAPIVEALQLLQRLHRSRNRVPVASTIAALLESTRAHVGFALEHGGEQVLANVTHVGDLARRYESEGGLSFRGFIDELRTQAESGEAGEAPILEEGSDGVRLMTVHKAKGLEFPIVIMADMTARLRASLASRHIDSERRVCAIRLGGCAPADLLEHEDEELLRDEAEGTRVAYVAATRARDLLVVPAVGDEEREGWIQPLNTAVYPAKEARRQQVQAAGCVEFKSKDSVLVRPSGSAGTSTVCPGLHVRKINSFDPHLFPPLRGAGEETGRGNEFSVVWWDPRALKLGAEAPLGIRRPELIVKDVTPDVVESGLAAYNSWRTRRQQGIADGSQSSVAVRTVTQAAKTAGEGRSDAQVSSVEIIELPRAANRPVGPRFGALVHAVLASVPLDSDSRTIQSLATIHGRILGAPEEEIAAAVEAVRVAFTHAVFTDARQAAQQGRCRREVPIAWRNPDGSLIEGVIDLAFEQSEGWTVVDFKTDEEFRENEPAYRRQVGMYASAVQAAKGGRVSALLMRV